MIEVYNITVSQMAARLGTSDADTIALLAAANLSDPLMAVFNNTELLSFFGFIPQTVISPTAHLWMWCEPSVQSHRVTFARKSREVIGRVLEMYPNIVGYCTTPAAVVWLRWLGAEFDAPVGIAHPFTIRKSQ